MEWLSDDERFLSIEENLKIIRDDIAEAALKAGRNSGDVSLMQLLKSLKANL